VGARLAFLLLACAVGGPAAGQEGGTQIPPGNAPGVPALTITSEPPGAVVPLKGPYEWVGVTPWRLFRNVEGLYQVEARRPGYETWRSEVVLGPGGLRDLSFRMSRKSTVKAFVRSALIPGWGQFYRGSSLKGTLFLAGSVLAGGAFAYTHATYQEEADDFKAAERRYEAATREEELAARWAEVLDRADDADRAWDRRQIALGALAGIYALNLVDVVFFPPAGDAAVPSGPGGPVSRAEPDGLGWSAVASPDGAVSAALHWSW